MNIDALRRVLEPKLLRAFPSDICCRWLVHAKREGIPESSITELLEYVMANLHFTLWMCIADDSSKVKGVKAVFIRISSKVISEQSSARLYF
jgi:hypothetical protein